jgi:hypothetical protein
MKRISAPQSAPILPDLLEQAASFDEKRISLDAYEVQALLECLARKAQNDLTSPSEMRLRTVKVQKTKFGSVSVRLECHKIFYFVEDTVAPS